MDGYGDIQRDIMDANSGQRTRSGTHSPAANESSIKRRNRKAILSPVDLLRKNLKDLLKYMGVNDPNINAHSPSDLNSMRDFIIKSIMNDREIND